MPNAVWRVYIQKKMPKWLAYIRAQPSLEVLSVAIRTYIDENPKIKTKKVEKDNFFQSFFLDEKFLNSLNEQGQKIASEVAINDILDELKPYAEKFSEILWVYNLIIQHLQWCNQNLVVMKKHFLQVAR